MSEPSVVKDKIVSFDTEQDVWRCTKCGWEVEPSSRLDGYCHCKQQDGGRRYHCFPKPLDEDPDDPFDPGDRENHSVDSDPDSEDDRFIDDDEIKDEEEQVGATEVSEWQDILDEAQPEHAARNLDGVKVAGASGRSDGDLN